MRFMMIVKASERSEAGEPPTAEDRAALGRYNEELARAGVMLDGEGLHASSRGVRVRFSRNGSTVVDGPFAGTRELVAGFWIIQVRSRDEAIEWARRIPLEEGEVELRQVFEPDDFASGDRGGDPRAAEEALRSRLADRR